MATKKLTAYQLAAKRINQRMLELEKSGNLGTEYKEIQEFLRELGVSKKGNAYRLPVRNPQKMGQEAYKQLQKTARKYSTKLLKRTQKKVTKAEKEKYIKKIERKVAKLEKYGLADKSQAEAFKTVKEQLEKAKAGKRTKYNIAFVANAASKIKVYKSDFQKQAEEANKRLKETAKEYDYLAAYKNNIKKLKELGFENGVIPHTPEQIKKIPEETMKKLDVIIGNILDTDMLTDEGRKRNLLPDIQERVGKYNARGFGYDERTINDISEMIYASRYDWTKLNRYLDSDQVIELTQEAYNKGSTNGRETVLKCIDMWEKQNGTYAPSKNGRSYYKFIDFTEDVVSFIRKNMTKVIEEEKNS